MLPPAPGGERAYALAAGPRSTVLWEVAGGAFGPERVAEIPGRCSGGVWLDRTGRMLAVDQETGGRTKAVVVDLERGGEVSPLLQIAADSDDRLLLADPDSGLVLIGSGLALGYAYLVRFLAIAVGGCENGLAQIPRALDQAARSLGHGPAASLRRLHLPLLRPALIAAALLVFVDTMKELSATLLLRPLGVETLATHLYGEAARGSHEDGAIAGLAIVAVGILPVIALARLAQRRGA